MFEAQKITYPGKGFNAWWDLPQLITQLGHIIKVFNHTHLGCVAIFVFDQSSAHKGFAEDALNVNNINVHPRGKQRKLCDTVIPLNNPEPAVPGKKDTCGQVQKMYFPDNYSKPELRGKPKGMQIILEEHKFVWAEYMRICHVHGMKVVG